jgi:hypothetical protein
MLVPMRQVRPEGAMRLVAAAVRREVRSLDA